MISPVLADQDFLDDVRAARESSEGFRLWWLGQSGFLLQWNNRHLLLDPYLSDSLTMKYANSDKPHVRMTGRVVDPGRLNFIAGVTSSHNHTDHLDGETLIPLLAQNPDLAVVVPAANQAFAADRLQVSAERLTPIDDGGSVTVEGFAIHAVPAAHEAVERDEEGRCRFLGYIVQFGPWTVYHSGDTILYDGLVERLAKFPIDVALLPINGRRPERRVSGNLWGREAVRLALDIGARLVIPCHFEMFDFNTVTPEEFVGEATRLQQPYRLLRCGQRWTSGDLGSAR